MSAVYAFDPIARQLFVVESAQPEYTCGLTVEVVPLRIELFKYRYYEDGVFALEPVNVSAEEAKTSIEFSAEKSGKKPVTDETKASSLDKLLAKASPSISKLFTELRERILSLDESIKEKATAYYVAYRASNNFAEMHIGKNQIKIHLRPIDYDDPKKSVEKIPDGYNWTLNRRVYLSSPDDLDYVVGILEQSYKNVL